MGLKEFFEYVWYGIANLFLRLKEIFIDEPPKINPDDNDYVAFAKTRRIKFLVHFTRIDNLPSIAEHGLLTRKNLDNNSVTYKFNDSNRYDNIKNSLSLSVTFPNYKMFFKYKGHAKNWAVILLDAEKIFATLPCAFHATNASANSERYRKLQERKTLDAFKRMFEGERKGRHLRDNETTDPQAEVICLADIPLKYFVGIVFEDSARLNENKKFFPNIPCRVDKSYFEPRHDWNYGKD